MDERKYDSFENWECGWLKYHEELILLSYKIFCYVHRFFYLKFTRFSYVKLITILATDFINTCVG